MIKGRLYAILDSRFLPRAKLASACEALIEGGSEIIQLRAKTQSTHERIQIMDAIFPLFEGSDVALIVNDHLELALRYPGVGLHVGQDDLEPLEARKRLGSERLLGLSTHSLEQTRRAIALGNALDYFALGPVFPTKTKPDKTAIGLQLVSKVANLQPKQPFFCIGGINETRLPALKAAGGMRVAVISALLNAPDIATATRHFKCLLEA